MILDDGQVVVTGELSHVLWVDKKDPDSMAQMISIKVLSESVESMGIQQGKNITLFGDIFMNINPGDIITATGYTEVHEKYGTQMKSKSIHVKRPTSKDGLINYLTKVVDGLGKVNAKKIVNSINGDLTEVIFKTPEKLKEIKTVSSELIEKVIQTVKEDIVKIDVSTFLMEDCGLTINQTNKIYKRFKEKTIQEVKEKTYSLIDFVDGLGFQTVDKIALSLGCEFLSKERIKAGIIYSLKQNHVSGNTAYKVDEFEKNTKTLLKIWGQEEHFYRALEDLISEEKVVRTSSDNSEVLQDKKMYDKENEIAAGIIGIVNTKRKTILPKEEVLREVLKKPLEDIDESIPEEQRPKPFTLSEEQIDAVVSSFLNKFTVITGGPGTGKTTIVSSLLRLISASNIGLKYYLCAPTGKASKRLQSKTQTNASTIHSLFKIGMSQEDEEEKNQPEQIQADYLIVDESSMVDTNLMHEVITRISPETTVIFVGDVDQLPSIGAGSILKNLIDSNFVNVKKLTVPRRTDENSSIIPNAHLINNGKMPAWDNNPNGDFFFIEANDEEISSEIKGLLGGKLKNFINNRGDWIINVDGKKIKSEFDINKHVQLLTPMNKGELGNDGLNKTSQEILNSNLETLEYKMLKYKVGDKIIQLKNDKELMIANGDVGVIKAIYPIKKDETAAEFKSPTRVFMEVEFEDMTDKNGLQIVTKLNYEKLDKISLAYSISIHKSQGSEMPIVIIPVTKSHYPMLEKNLFYTGITRAKQMVILIGDSNALQIAVKNNRSNNRVTCLKDKLLDNKILFF